jgi:hypothetical protein
MTGGERRVRSVDGVPRGLTVTYQPEGSAGIGEIGVSASVPPFGGASVGYLNDDDLRAFAEVISVYPLPDEARPALITDLGGQETIGLTVFQVTSRGQLAVAIHLAVIDLDHSSATSGAVSDAHMLLLTSYQALHDFATELVAAIDAHGGTARLPIEEFS